MTETVQPRSVQSVALAEELPQLDPEREAIRGFLGAVMASTHDRAAAALGLVEPGDITLPVLATVYRLIREVVDLGLDPDPRVILGQFDAHAPTPAQRHALGQELVECYAGAVTTAEGFWAGRVREASGRRKVFACGELLQQLARSAPVDVLVEDGLAQTAALGAVLGRLTEGSQ